MTALSLSIDPLHHILCSFRARQGTFRPAAGLGPIPVAGIENIDLTEIVHGHGDYIKKMDKVLQKLHLAQPSAL